MTQAEKRDCSTCRGNEVDDDGYPCPDCQWDDDRSEEDDDEYMGPCVFGGPAPCIDDICHAVGGCMHWEAGR